MRLTAIELENFKGIGPRQRIELKPITLLFGPNSAGKSTILQALHYFREILERKNVDPDVTIAGGLLNLGGFKSVVHKHDLSQPVRIKVELDFSADESIEHLPINSERADAVGGDFSGLDIGYIAREPREEPVPHGTVHQVALELELRWSKQHLAPYVARWEVGFNPSVCVMRKSRPFLERDGQFSPISTSNILSVYSRHSIRRRSAPFASRDFAP